MKRRQAHAISPTRKRGLVTAIGRGVPVRMALSLCQIPESTYYNWLAVARKTREATESKRKHKPNAFEAACVDLIEALEKAAADFVSRNLAGIEAAGKKSWQARAWLLERRHPELFARRTNVTVDTGEAPPRKIDPAELLKVMGRRTLGDE